MPRRYKEARLAKGIKLNEATKLFGVAQPTISAWENERKSPPIDILIKMAELYDVSIDYLLGADIGYIAPDKVIPNTNIKFFHGKPVWSKQYGWAIVDASNKELVFADKRLPITDVLDVYTCSSKFSESIIPEAIPLKHGELKKHQNLWLEPISLDEDLRQELRGWYTVSDRYVENEFGHRFYFDTYEVKWLAYNSSTQ